MKYLDTLKRINEEIATLNEHKAYLLDSEDEFIAKSQEYVFNRNKFGKYMVYDIALENVELKMKKDLVDIESRLVELKRVRDQLIEFILKATRISTVDVIELAAKFGIYLKTEDVGTKKLLVPYDLCIIRSGINSVASEEELIELMREVNNITISNGQIVMKRPLNVVPLYVRSKHESPVNNDEEAKTVNDTASDIAKKPKTFTEFLKYLFGNSPAETEQVVVKPAAKKSNVKISVNSNIAELASGAEITINGGLQIYKRDGDNIVFNSEVLNLFPYDVLAFFDYYLDKLFENPNINIMDVCKSYLKEVPVGGLSYDDPAMNDTYRRR